MRTLLDLMTVIFLSGYSTRPIQVFGAIGLLLGSAGSLWMAILVFEKVVLGLICAIARRCCWRYCWWWSGCNSSAWG